MSFRPSGSPLSASLLRLTVPRLVVWLLLAPALIAGERYLVAPPGPGSLTASTQIAAAFGPEHGFAIWGGGGGIWGVPLTLDGRPLAPARRLIDTGRITNVSLVHSDDGFVAFWIEEWNLTRVAQIGDDWKMRNARTITPQGGPLVASNGTRGFIFRGQYSELRLTVLDEEWNPLRVDPWPTASTDRLRGVVLDDGSFALAAGGWDGLYLMRYHADGTPDGAPRLIEPSVGRGATAYRPNRIAMATDGSSVLVAWTGSRYNTPVDLKRAVIARDDSSSGVAVIGRPEWAAYASLEAAFAAGEYTLLASAGEAFDDVSLYGVRLGPTGELRGEWEILYEGPRGHLLGSLERSPDGYLAFVEERAGPAKRGISLLRLPAVGSFLRPDPRATDGLVSASSKWQSGAVAASDGFSWLVAWIESSSSGRDVFARHLADDGAPVGSVVPLRSAELIEQTFVTFDGTGFVVSWIEGGTLMAKRFWRDGWPIDREPLTIHAGAVAPFSAASSHGVTLFAWATHPGAIEGALLLASGQTKPSFVIAAPAADEPDRVVLMNPIVSGGRESFLVAWTEFRPEPGCYFPVCGRIPLAQARLISRSGSPVSPVWSFDEWWPRSAASDGSGHLLTFHSSSRVAWIREGSPAPVLSSVAPGAAPDAFAARGGYLLVQSCSPLTTVRRLSSAGEVVGDETIDCRGRPAAANQNGDLLILTSERVDEEPYHGNMGIYAEVQDPSVPASAPRRRPLRR